MSFTKRFLMLFTLGICCIGLYAYNFEKDGIYYQISGDDVIVAASPYSSPYAGDITIPSSVIYNETTYTVIGVGNNAFSSCSSLTSINLPQNLKTIGNYAFRDCSSLTSIDLPENLKTIGNCAFMDCSSLTSIDLPENLETIGNYAFNGCEGLTTIEFPDMLISVGNGAFGSCTKLKSIHIPASLQHLGTSVFSGCTLLTNVTFEEPSSLQKIPSFAFSNTALKEFKVPSSIVSIDERSFENTSLITVTGCENLDSIGDCAFSSCSKLTTFSKLEDLDNVKYLGKSALPYKSLSKGQPIYTKKWFLYMPNSFAGIYNIPNGIEVIRESAFEDCDYLTSVNMPSSVTEIQEEAFQGCNNLVSIDIPSSVKTIGDDVFSSCYNLTVVTLHEGLERIGMGAFRYCSSLNNFVIPTTVISIGVYAFSSTGWFKNQSDGLLYKDNCLLERKNFTSSGELTVDYGTRVIAEAALASISCSVIYLPNTLKAIGKNGFVYGKMKLIDIPNSVEIIEERAFEQCRSLVQVTFGNSLKYIGKYAFDSCTQLQAIDIPNSVIEIGNSAFAGCNLKNISIGENVKTIGENAFVCSSLVDVFVSWDEPIKVTNNFNSRSSCTLHVPCNTSEKYRNTEVWKDFGSIVENSYNVTLMNSEGNRTDMGLRDGSSMEIQDNIQSLKVQSSVMLSSLSYSRTYKNTNWQAWYVPFDLTITNELLERFSFAKYAGTYTDEEEFYLTVAYMKEGEKLKANTPYFIKAKTANSTTPQVITVEDATLYPTVSRGMVMLSAEKKIEITGIYTTKTATSTDCNWYAYGGGKYIKASVGQQLSPFRFFLTITNREDNPYADSPTPNEVKVMLIGENGEETSIEDIELPELSAPNDVYYDLQGRKVSNPQKGIFIKNGKKTFIK